MYPEDTGSEPLPPEPMPAATGFKSRFSYHLEGLIPLILIIIIGFFVLAKFEIISPSTPVVGPIVSLIGGKAAPLQILIIGMPSAEMQSVLDKNKDLLFYRIKEAAALNVNPKEQLAQYDIVILDQSNQANKAVSRALGEAIENYVRTGGKLIVVKDSGIYRESSTYPGIAPDVVGWKATFGDIVPVECAPGTNNVPTCVQPIAVRGIIFREKYDHKIMEGIEFSPPLPEMEPYFLETFDVTPTGTEIAYIKDVVTPRYYPAIVEKNLIVGKVIYFNYDPGITETILEKTIEYLR